MFNRRLDPWAAAEKSFTDLRLQPAEAPKIGRQVLGAVSHVDISIRERPRKPSHHRNIRIVDVTGQPFDDLRMLGSIRVEYIAMVVTNGIDQINSP